MVKRKLFAASLFILIAITLGMTGCEKNDNESKGSKDTEDETTQEATIQPTAAPQATAQPTPEVFDTEPTETVDVNYSRVSVHDPSIIKTNGSYYVFGSHMAWAKSDDLTNWKTFRNNINSDFNNLLGDIWSDYCRTETNTNLGGNLWAPDVIYNEAMSKYCIYMSVNGDNWNSVIVLLTADDVEGPYEYVGPIVYSGFNTTSHPVEKTDVYQVLGEGADIQRYQSTNNTKLNAIDPNVRYDDDGNLWMSFGSWFGGLYLLKLNNETGLRDYDYTYITKPNVSDQYYGYKIAGGNGVSGEGPYIIKYEDYYYLFVSYGGLAAEGGYQMRVFRSEKIMGPYVDENGVSAIYPRGTNNLTSKIGIRMLGSFKFTGNLATHVAQGHNSAFVDDDGKIYLVYHTRFAGGKNGIPEAHEVRVQQMFVNENGWLIAAPYEYSGETISDIGYTKKEMTGEYEFVIHKPDMFYQHILNTEIGIAVTQNIAFYSDGTVGGDMIGTWTYTEGTANMTITVDGVEYKGVFLKQANEIDHKLVMTFTALGSNVTVMGSKK